MASPYPPPRVLVFDDRRGASEGDELDKLLGIFPASTSRDAAAADVGLVQGVAGFMAPFQDAVDSPDAAGDDEPPPGGRRGGIGGSQPPPPTAPLPHQTLRTRDRRIACRMCEPHVWFALALHSRAAPPSAVRDGALHALLERLHADFVFANGTVAALLAADASGGAARDALAPYVADLGARLRPRGGPGWGAGHGALRSEALALNPATPAFADPPSPAGVSEARGGERERLAFAPLSEARDREADREVALAVAACAEVSEAYDRDADADEGSRARPPRALIRGAAVLADDRVVWATTDLRAALGRARRSERSDFFVPESEARAASESPSSLDEKEAAFDARRSASETAAFARYAVRCLAPGTDARHTRAFAEAVRAEADEATRRLDEWVRDARRAGGGAEGGDAEVRARVRARPPPFMASEWTDEADPNPNNPNPNDPNPNPNPNDPNSDPTTRPPPPSPPPPSPPPPSPPPVRVVRRSARARVGASRADPDPSAAADPSASRVAVWTTTGVGGDRRLAVAALAAWRAEDADAAGREGPEGGGSVTLALLLANAPPDDLHDDLHHDDDAGSLGGRSNRSNHPRVGDSLDAALEAAARDPTAALRESLFGGASSGARARDPSEAPPSPGGSRRGANSAADASASRSAYAFVDSGGCVSGGGFGGGVGGEESTSTSSLGTLARARRRRRRSRVSSPAEVSRLHPNTLASLASLRDEWDLLEGASDSAPVRAALCRAGDAWIVARRSEDGGTTLFAAAEKPGENLMDAAAKADEEAEKTFPGAFERL